jgi:hypothetical protein
MLHLVCLNTENYNFKLWAPFVKFIVETEVLIN